MQIGDSAKIYAIANEDLERSTEDKTSAVHFLRFELNSDGVAAMKNAEPVVFGSDHPELTQTATLTEEQRASLAADLD